jgi:hypothetical protein
MKRFKKYILLSVIPFIMTACAMSEKNSDGGDVSGTGGSLARFTISGNYLYTVDQNSLHTISLADVEHPKNVADKSLGIYTETIFPYQNSLLLGTETGMFVFDITSPSNPQQVAFYQHIRSCDPVVAQNGFAYLTLHTSNQRCFSGTNELQIIDLSNLNYPQTVKTIFLTTPLGLDINNDTLYVCDKGLRVFNVTNKQNPVELNYFGDIDAQDVICQQGSIIVIATNGLYQYKYTGGVLTKISSIPIL